MNQNKQLIILENFSVLSEDCIQSSPALEWMVNGFGVQQWSERGDEARIRTSDYGEIVQWENPIV